MIDNNDNGGNDTGSRRIVYDADFKDYVKVDVYNDRRATPEARDVVIGSNALPPEKGEFIGMAKAGQLRKSGAWTEDQYNAHMAGLARQSGSEHKATIKEDQHRPKVTWVANDDGTHPEDIIQDRKYELVQESIDHITRESRQLDEMLFRFIDRPIPEHMVKSLTGNFVNLYMRVAAAGGDYQNDAMVETRDMIHDLVARVKKHNASFK